MPPPAQGSSGSRATRAAVTGSSRRRVHRGTVAQSDHLMERRSKLLDLDAAVQVNIEERLREEARKLGVDEEVALAAAARIIKPAGARR